MRSELPDAGAGRDVARTMRPFLLVALFALSVAAATGVILRFGLVQGMPSWASNYAAVRHAHSHLMYFGWGTLGIMALIWTHLPNLTGRALPRGVTAQMWLTAVLALLSFPAFWANGYGTTKILGRSLPLGSMAAALNGLPWFVFAWLYWRATRGMVVRPLPVALWDWALVLLLLASAGAMTLGLQVAMGLQSEALREASLHLFLDLFAVGWFTLAMLGLLWAWPGAERWPTGWVPVQSIAILVAATFVLGMSPSVVPQSTFWIAALANLAAAILLARHLWLLTREWSLLPLLVRFALVLFALHLATAVAVVVPGVWRWAAGTQLRIFFLHNLLLGWMSSALFGLILASVVSPRAGRVIAVLWMTGVALMLAALLGLGFAGIVPVSAVTWLRMAAWSSLLPATAAVLALVSALVSPRRPPVLTSP